MLTRLRIKNFKKLADADLELGQSVVSIGPNNSGKTTALQALALWDIGLRRWNEKRQGKASPEKRPGVTVNRKDITSIPVPGANLLWRDLHVREVVRMDGKPLTQNVRIEIIVDGITAGVQWSCGLEFDYANEESLYCRPLRHSPDDAHRRLPVPLEASRLKVAFLPPMSGLAAIEPKWEPGRISVLLGEGQTAQVLRNLCFQIYEGSHTHTEWRELCELIKMLFGVTLQPPQYVKERGEITMTYNEASGIELDLAASGRGLQQTLLVLAHLYANKETVLLLDEPDAHLEILRQRQIYQLLNEIAAKNGSQIIAASHSEVILNEAAGKNVVIAFVGSPHRIDNGGRQVLKSLAELGIDQYYQAEQTGWVLYLEGPSDLAILQAFARTLQHPVMSFIERPFVHYVTTNLPQRARDHFYGLREAKRDLVGFALFDRLDKELHQETALTETMWQRREIENYLCRPEVLLTYARAEHPTDLFALAERQQREQAMNDSIAEVTAALRTLGKPEPWSEDIKASDDFLAPPFQKYFERLGLPNLMSKNNYHTLAGLADKEQLDPEVAEKLDAIVKVALQANPYGHKP